MFFSKPGLSRDGFLLVDVVIAMAVMSLMMGMTLSVSVLVTDRIRLHRFATQLYYVMTYGRQLAMAKDQDVMVVAGASAVSLTDIESKILKKIEIPSGIVVTVSPRIGFTSLGMTKYAGTIVVLGPSSEEKLTVGVGYGRISLQ